MSVEAAPDSELRDLVAQALENNGLLSKLRAELRASVFLTLEENGKFQSKKFINAKLRNFANTAEGCLVISLVRDFLDHFGLEFTLSVFEPEAGLGKDYDYEKKEKIITKLNLENSNDDEKPLLSQVVDLLVNMSKNKEGVFCDKINSTVETRNTRIENSQNSISCNGNEENHHRSDKEGDQIQPRNCDIANQNDFTHSNSSDAQAFSLSRNLTGYSSMSANFNPVNQRSFPPLECTNSSQQAATQNMKSLAINIDNNFQDEHVEDLLKTNSSLRSETLLSRNKTNDDYLHGLQSHTFSGSEIEEEISSGDQFNDSLSLGDEDILSDAASPTKKIESKFSL